MRKTTFMLFLLAVPLLPRVQGVSTEGKGSMVGIKSNIPYWATATFNLGVEVYLARRWTSELKTGLNPFSGKNDDGSYGRSLKRLRLHPELRYRFCETFSGHFLGAHIPYLLYNVVDIRWLGTGGECRQGRGAGASISHGYSWLLSYHRNLEATVSVGYLCLKSDKYPCANCGRKQEGIKKHCFGPTQATINLTYQFQSMED